MPVRFEQLVMLQTSYHNPWVNPSAFGERFNISRIECPPSDKYFVLFRID